MINRNAFKTSLLFLGIILAGIFTRMLLVGDEALTKDGAQNEIATIVCSLKKTC